MASWKAIKSTPGFNVSTMLLLTDGSVMCQASGGKSWSRLKPDPKGNYVNGSWSTVAPMHHTRLYYASAVLNDGRVFVAGGEWSDAGDETNTCEIYEPLTDTWTEIAAPTGWARIGDAPCVVLPDGRLLVGQIDDQRTAIFDPAANSWSAGPQKLDASSEESWVLMPDETVLTAQCSAHPGSEQYVVATDSWMSAGNTTDDLVEAASIEIGAGILLPDGRALFIGATPHTARYTPAATAGNAGTWAAGPAIPNDASGTTCGAKDAPACLMTNGHVLITIGPVDGVSGDYLGPTYFYEYDGHGLVKITAPPNAGAVPFVGRMLLLPTGEILYASGTKALYAYGPAPAFQDAWRPEILTAPSHLISGFGHSLSGRRLNGMSQAVGYGDDAAAATNYPLVRLQAKNGKIYYCRTFGHSTMGVATGSATHTTSFLVSSSVPAGSYELTVVANGIPSEGVMVSVSAFVIPFPWAAIWQWLVGSLADGPLWAIGPNGPVPVDPWGPKYRGDVRQARRDIVAGIKVLQKIGQAFDKTRVATAGKATPQVDPEFTAFLARQGRKAVGGTAKIGKVKAAKPRAAAAVSGRRSSSTAARAASGRAG